MKTDRKTEVKRGHIVDRTEKVVQKLVEDSGISVGQAMRDAGFNPGYAKNPQYLKDTLKFNKLLKKYLPDDTLTKKHNQLLESGKISQFVFRLDATDEEIKAILEDAGSRFLYIKNHPTGRTAYFTAPDNDAQLKALDLAYKLKGKVNRDGGDGGGNVSQEIQAVIVRIRSMLPDSQG